MPYLDDVAQNFSHRNFTQKSSNIPNFLWVVYIETVESVFDQLSNLQQPQ